MKETHTHVDGAPRDGVGHSLATPDQLSQYEGVEQSLREFKVPVLIHSDNAHERLFVVAFDGTGNNKFSDPDHATNVARISDQIKASGRLGGSQIYTAYVEGPGTQAGALRSVTDSMLGYSYASNVDEAYDRLVKGANRWSRSDPDVVVRVHSIGFSRGASQVPGLARKIHDSGIPDLKSEILDTDGSTRYSRYIAEPGKVVQTVGLFDPVATGVPMQFDRRLPPSVVSGFQITATDELRKSFPSDQILPPGLSEDGRFLNVMVPGAHSDVGGGYLRNGLSIRCGNLMRDYCNALSDTPYLEKEFAPADQRYNVIHRSQEGMDLYRADPRVSVRGESSGTNDVLAPRHMEHAGPAPHRPEAVNPMLNAGLERRGVVIGPANLAPGRTPMPTASMESMLEAGKSVSFGPAVRRYVGAVGTGIDIAQTAREVSNLHAQGNTAGLTSKGLHFASRNAGGWAGAELLGAAGAAAGVESGPGLFVTGAVGMAVGFVAGDKLGDAYDSYKVNHQKDPQGNTWTMDTQHGWIRDLPPLPETPRGQRQVAEPVLANRLDYQAANIRVELALAREYTPSDPFTQPAAAGDTPSIREAPWLRDTQTHQWSRRVVDGVLEHGITRSHREEASPQRSTELDTALDATVQRNAAESPWGVAKQYQHEYDQLGWAKHGPMPEAVGYALSAPLDKIMASDGERYSHAHDKGGAWERPGMIYGTNEADVRISAELNLSEHVIKGMRNGPSSVAVALPSAPAVPARLDDPAHPDHAFFKQVQSQVAALDRSVGRTPDQYTDQVSSALMVQARTDGMKRVDMVALSTDGEAMWAVQTPPGRTDHLFDLRTSVPTAEANTPMEQSGAKWPEAMQRYQGIDQSQQMSQQQSMERQQAENQAQGATGPSMVR
jgi:hypothetical protein